MTDLHLGSIRFAGDLPIWIVLILVPAAVLAVLALYLRETKSIASPYRYILPSLRATSVAMVLFILTGPVWHHRQVVGTLGRVIFAVDTSKSMSLTDSQAESGKDDRLMRASRLLLGNDSEPGWIEEISKTHLIDVISFDSGDPVSVWSSVNGERRPTAFDLSADAAATDIARPLDSVLSSLNLDGGTANDNEPSRDSMRRAAIVMMTDGRNTVAGRSGGRSPSAIAKRLASGGTQVYTLGLGSSGEPPDVGIVQVIRPDSVASEGKLAGEIVVKRFGDRSESVTLRIESEGETVWREVIEIGGSDRARVPFSFDVMPLVEAKRRSTVRGIERANEVLRLTAMVESSGPDFAVENNAVNFRVSASTRDRRLLIVDSSSRWETRYLKNLYQRDPAWDVDVVLFGAGTSTPTLQRGSAPGEFPLTATDMSRYDAVLLGEVESEQMSEKDRELIARFVADGGGLTIIDGRNGRMQEMVQGRFAELMPVQFDGPSSVVAPLHLRITPAGSEQPTMRLIDETERLREIWTKLPAPRWSAEVSLSEGAEAWAEVIRPDGRATPWLATRMYGAGRVFYFASDQTWRWRYKVADQFHARFWNQLVIAAMEPPYSASDQYVSLGTDKVEYGMRDSIAIRARLRDTRGKPVSGATVDALIVRDNQVVGSVPLALENPNRGTYSGLGPADAKWRVHHPNSRERI